MGLKHISGTFALGIGLIIGSSGASHALVMDFGTNDGSEVVEFGSFTQNDLTMSPVNSETDGPNHWDRLGSLHGATASDNSAGIHSGRNADEVTFTYLGGGRVRFAQYRYRGINAPRGLLCYRNLLRIFQRGGFCYWHGYV